MEDLTARLPSAEVDDLPALVRFVVQHASGPAGQSVGGPAGRSAAGGAGSGAATAAGVVAALRRGLPMVDPAEPRVAVQDPGDAGKGKGARGGGGAGGRREAAEVALLRELSVALAANEAASHAVLKVGALDCLPHPR